MTDEISKLYANDDLSELSRVTLVIPTYNRNFYLSRCLWYHAHFPFAEIIVADSSPQEKRAINKKIILELSDRYTTKITYLEYDYPAEEYGGEIYRKWGDAVQHSSTEYALSCTDKEFLVPTTVVKSAQFLDKNPDYSLADGIYYMMNSKREILPWQEKTSITKDTPKERLNELKLVKNILGTQFALHRTAEYKECFENLIKYSLFDIRFGETLIETFPILMGKLYRNQDTVMSIRDTTEFYKQDNIINCIYNNLEKKKNESSFFRYKPYDKYPINRRYELLNKYRNCIENTSKINEDITFYSKIMEIRYSNPQNKIYTFSWKYLIPYRIKYALSHLLGSGKMEKKIVSENEPDTITYIFKMIEITRQYIPTDTPITQTNIFQGDLE